MFNRLVYENSAASGYPVLEIQPEGERGEQRRLFVPLQRSELTGTITGPLAQLTLSQVFRTTAAQSPRVIEAVYRFPLPGDAAVTGVDVRFGDVAITARLKERAEAEAEYDVAKRQGRLATLLTRESPDVFTLQVVGIQPDQDVTVETSFVQLARVEGGGWSLRLPLTTAPRYTRSDEFGSRHAQGQPLMVMRDPGHRFALDVRVVGAAVVASPTHALDVAPAGDAVRVRLQAGEVLPDRDCLLTWQPVQDATRPALQVLRYDDTLDGHDYFLALAVPPAQPPAQRVGREVILLVDRSGSMSGPKWDAALWTVKRFLLGLTEADHFNLGLFDNEVAWFQSVPVSGTDKEVTSAMRFMTERPPRGGTELGVALEQALSQPRFVGGLTRHVLIVTDAQVSDAGRVVRLADQEALRADRRRLSVICIDAAPNDMLVNDLVERGGGVARFLTSLPDEDDITTALDDVLADWDAPILQGLRLEVRDEHLAGALSLARPGHASGWSALDMGDLPAGRPRWVAGRVLHTASALDFRLLSGEGERVAQARVEPATSPDLNALKALFGARRVLALEYLMHAGYDASDLRDRLERLGYRAADVLGDLPPRVYAENQRADQVKALRGLLVREALDYGLASAETAFVATRTEAGRPVEATVAVGNALPAGWSERFLSEPPRMAAMAMASGPVGAKRSAGGGPSVRSCQMAFAADAGPTRHIAEEPPPPRRVTLFSGVPQVANGEAVLLDQSGAPGKKALPTFLRQLSVAFPDGAPAALDPDLTLCLYVGDLVKPVVRVRLAELLRLGGERPLNVRTRGGEAVRLVLLDPHGAWASGAPKLQVTVA